MWSLRSAAKGVVSATGARISSAVLSVLLLGFMARHWSTSEVGAYATVLGFFELLQQVPLLGLHQRLAREVSLDAAATASVATATAAIGLSASLLVGILLGGVGSLGDPSISHAFWLAGASLVPTAIIEASQAVLIGQQRLPAIARVAFVEVLIRTGLISGCIWLGTGLTAIFTVFFACRCLAAMLHLIWSGTAEVVRPSYLNGASLRAALHDARSFLPILLLSAFNNRAAIVILSLIGTAGDVGLYSSAAKLYELLLLLPNVAVWALYPLLAQIFMNERSYLARLLHDWVAVGLLIGLPCAIAASCFAGTVIELVFGTKFYAASGVLRLLLVAAVFVALDKTLAALLIAARRQDLDLKVLATSSPVYLALLLALVYVSGYIGAAIATLSAMFVQWALRLAATRHVLSPPENRQRLWLILCAAAVMAMIVGGLTPFAGRLTLPLAMVVYAIMAIRIGAASVERSLRGLVLMRAELSPPSSSQ